MKRVLALALVVGALLGGCDRQRVAQPGGSRPEVASTTSATRTGPTSAAVHPAAEKSAAADDVDSLLTDVDKQLSSDSQPQPDQD